MRGRSPVVVAYFGLPLMGGPTADSGNDTGNVPAAPRPNTRSARMDFGKSSSKTR